VIRVVVLVIVAIVVVSALVNFEVLSVEGIGNDLSDLKEKILGE